ncbi:MAG: VOC family protein [Bacteroidota bacterium]
MSNAINWFELPATNFERAMNFYNQVLDAELQPIEMGDIKMGFFPHADGGVGGAIACGEGYNPTADGPVIYLNGGEDLAIPLAKVVPAGGKVVLPKTSIGENGFYAMFLDSEGNRVAFHSMN